MEGALEVSGWRTPTSSPMQLSGRYKCGPPGGIGHLGRSIFPVDSGYPSTRSVRLSPGTASSPRVAARSTVVGAIASAEPSVRVWGSDALVAEAPYRVLGAVSCSLE